MIIVEPGLIKMTGHPIQYVLALQELGQHKGIEVHIVPNRGVEAEVLACLHSSFPLISHTCFQFTPNGSMAFYNELCQLQEQYHFNQEDLVIVTSCYVKEIEGIATFEKNTVPSCCPRIAMNFHQLFPPANVSEVVCAREYQELWLEKLNKAFSLIQDVHTKISLWTTASEALNETYRMLARRQVGILPFLFNASIPNEGTLLCKSLSGKLKLAFLGDGRQEKGLLLFLDAIQSCFRSHDRLGFVIQNIDARGYNTVEWETLRSLIYKVKTRSDTVVIEEPLSPQAFSSLLRTVDAVVLPYHPKHYDRRASMLFAQVVVNQKPVVVSSGTWMAEEIRKGNASGVVFDYVTSDSKATVGNLKEGILELQDNIELYRSRAEERSGYYQAFHTTERYLQTMLDYYEQRSL